MSVVKRVPTAGARSSTPLSAEEVVACLHSGQNVFIHGACATPLELLEAMVARPDLERMQLYHLHLNGTLPFADEEASLRFRSHSLFVGSNLRAAVAEGRADFVPIFLSDIPWLFRSGKVALDVALVQLSPPDAHGYCSLGTSVDAARAACDHARLVLAVINHRMPRTHGDTFVHLDRIHRYVEVDRSLVGVPRHEASPLELAVGAQVASLIKPGDTLQLGIGGIADAVAQSLATRPELELGLHTEMFSDAAADLIRAGVITNRHKAVHGGKSITSFVNGGEALFALVHDNPSVEFHPCDLTNDPGLIRQHDRMVAINGALEIDLTGQVCADSMGHVIYSGIGGQMDFLRGAATARGGKPVIALPSTARGGTISRIVATLTPGAGVVTTRGHVHWVVTEYGAVNLHGLSIRERAAALIQIAHPDVRSELRAAARSLHHLTG